MGRLVLPDGRVKEGLFRNNKFCGEMKIPRKKTSIGSIREEIELEEMDDE